MKDGMMGHGEVPESTTDRFTVGLIAGSVGAGVAGIIFVAAHYLNVNAGPLPFILAVLFGAFAVRNRDSRVRPRRPPEHHDG